jgi:hypothetical protein
VIFGGEVVDGAKEVEERDALIQLATLMASSRSVIYYFRNPYIDYV